MQPKDAALTIDKLNQLINVMLKVDTIDKALAVCFSKETLVENNSLNEYKSQKIGDMLKECIYIKKCRKLALKDEQLNEGDLIVILRYLLKKFNYKFVADVIKKNNNLRIYSIVQIGHNS